MSSGEPLTPWANQPDKADPLARLWGGVPQPEPLSDAERQRVAIRLRYRSKSGGARLVLRFVTLGIVVGVAGAASAQWATLRWMGSVQRQQVVSVSRPLRPPPALVPQPSLPVASSVLPTPEPLPLEPEPSQFAPEAVTPLVSSSRLALEASSLEVALVALRRGGTEQAARALTALDRHLRDYPRGSLELEARVARVEALLLLGRRQEASRELIALPLERVGRKQELRLIRAELQADDDCRAALRDFQILVEQPLPTAWAERALFGRAGCLLRTGDASGAQRDFALYLARFPQGRFAAQIRAQELGAQRRGD